MVVPAKFPMVMGCSQRPLSRFSVTVSMFPFLKLQVPQNRTVNRPQIFIRPAPWSLHRHRYIEPDGMPQPRRPGLSSDHPKDKDEDLVVALGEEYREEGSAATVTGGHSDAETDGAARESEATPQPELSGHGEAAETGVVTGDGGGAEAFEYEGAEAFENEGEEIHGEEGYDDEEDGEEGDGEEGEEGEEEGDGEEEEEGEEEGYGEDGEDGEDGDEGDEGEEGYAEVEEGVEEEYGEEGDDDGEERGEGHESGEIT